MAADDPLRSHYPVPEKAQRFEGQLKPSFQRMLCDLHAEVTAEQCHFYHTLDLGGGEVVEGGWDLRGYEGAYLGHLSLPGQRVIEFGPASGYLTFWMEAQGATVTAFDLAPGLAPDLVPLPGVDLEAHARSGAETARQVRNSWWYAHARRRSSARAVYGDIYALPSDIGRYDVSTFGSILLHLERPFAALREAARITEQAMVITDLLPDLVFGGEHNSFVEFNPGEEEANLVNWWRISPGAAAKMLRVLGFPHVEFHYFEGFYRPHHDPGQPAEKRFMYSAVGRRKAGLPPREPPPAAALEVDRRVRVEVPVITVENYNDAHGRLNTIHRSLAWKLAKPLRLVFPPRGPGGTNP